MTPSAHDDAHTTAVIRGLFKHFEGAPTQSPVTHNPGDNDFYDRGNELGKGTKLPKKTPAPKPSRSRPDKGDRL
jgi:hypothetical protein